MVIAVYSGIHGNHQVVSKYFSMYVDVSIPMDVKQTLLSRTTLATNIPRDVITAAGVPFEEFIVTCFFTGQVCNRSVEFRRFFDTYYYNCYTYNPSWGEGGTSLSEGMENGLSIVVLTGSGMLDRNPKVRVIPGSHEWLSPISGSEGVRVVLHPPGTQPYPHTEGYDVAPGFSASFGIRARENVRIGPPHGNCSTAPSDTDSSYRMLACQKFCLQAAVVAECACVDITLPGQDQYLANGHHYCSDDSTVPQTCSFNFTPACKNALMQVYSRYVCARNVNIQKMHANAKFSRECGCYPACYELNYDVTYSLAKWPATRIDGEVAYVDIFHAEKFLVQLNFSLS